MRIDIDDESEWLLSDKHSKEKEHQELLDNTIDVAKAFVISPFIGFISDIMITTSYILFAQTMDDRSSIISLMVLSQSIAQIIGILIASYFSDKFGFDTLSIFTATILLIAVIIQTTSYNIIQFIIGVFLKGLVMDDIEILSLGFFGKLLPINDAAVYIGYFYSFTTFSEVLGFIIGGLLITYIDYRYVFIISTFIVFIRWIYIVYYIRNKQNILIEKQLQFVSYYKSLPNVDNNNMFPICLEQIQSETTKKEKKDIDIIHWIELILNIIQFSLVSSQYLIEFQFLTLYMLTRFNIDAILAMSQMIVASVTYTIITFIVPEYFENISLIKKYIISVPLYILCCILYTIANPYTNKSIIYLYWIWSFCIGILSGILCIITEISILELQPMHHTGKINGFKTLCRYGFIALATALIAYYWDINDHIWFWYFQALAFLIPLLCVIMIMIIKNFYPSPPSKEKDENIDIIEPQQ